MNSDDSDASIDVPPLRVWLLILTGLGVTGVLAFLPALQPTLAIAPGVLDQVTVQLIFVAAAISHILQGSVAALTAKKLGLPATRWGLQTLGLGIPSTARLFERAGQRGAALLSAGSFLGPLLLMLLVRHFS